MAKNELFTRPVLILKTFNKLSMLAIPLTSKKKSGSWYSSFKLNDKPETAVLVQARCISVHRLLRKMGTISEQELSIVRHGFTDLIEEKISPSITTGVGIIPKYKIIITNIIGKIKRLTCFSKRKDKH